MKDKTAKEKEVFDLIDKSYNNHWHFTTDLVKQGLAEEIVKLFSKDNRQELENLKKMHVEANEFIIETAKMLNIDTDGIGFDELTLSLDDFQDAINEIKPDKEKSECNHLSTYVDRDNFQKCQKCDEIID